MRTPARLLLLTLLLTTALAGDALAKKMLPPVHKVPPCGAEQAVVDVATQNDEGRLVYLDDYVQVTVCNLAGFLEKASKDQQPVSLFINGLDAQMKPIGIDYDAGTLTFVLDRTEQNKAIWTPLLYNPLFLPTEEIVVSVGEHGEKPLPRVAGANMHLALKKLYIDRWVILWFLLLAAIVISCIMYARRSDMLRDQPRIGGQRQSYSLARTQMAWWFIMIVVGFVFIWLVTGDRDTIPPTLLGLMGISAVTALAAIAVGGTAADRAAAQRKRLDDARASLDDSISRIDTELATLAAVAEPTPVQVQLQKTLIKTRTEQETARAAVIAETAAVTTLSPSRGFWHDLVTDERGATALDRFQIVVWTVVLGGVFVTSVVWNLTMPEFNGTLLALMGISSGTYVGFKLPQKS